MPDRLTTHLVEQGLLTPAAEAEAIQRQVLMGGAVDTALLELGHVDEKEVIKALGSVYNVPTATAKDLSGIPNPKSLRTVPEQWARRHKLAPLWFDEPTKTLSVLSPAPPDKVLIGRWSELLEVRLDPILAPEFRIEERLAALYEVQPGDRYYSLIQLFGNRTQISPVITTPSEEHLNFAEAVTRLREPNSRDHIAHISLSYISRNVEFAALFVVQDGFLDGWMGHGSNAERIRGASIPVEPNSAFRVVLDTRSHYLGPLAKNSSHTNFLEPIGRSHPKVVFIAPLRIKNRTVALLYMDNGPKQISEHMAADTLLFLSHVQTAMLTLVLRKKTPALSHLIPSALQDSTSNATASYINSDTPRNSSLSDFTDCYSEVRIDSPQPQENVQAGQAINLEQSKDDATIHEASLASSQNIPNQIESTPNTLNSSVTYHEPILDTESFDPLLSISPESHASHQLEEWHNKTPDDLDQDEAIDSSFAQLFLSDTFSQASVKAETDLPGASSASANQSDKIEGTVFQEDSTPSNLPTAATDNTIISSPHQLQAAETPLLFYSADTKRNSDGLGLAQTVEADRSRTIDEGELYTNLPSAISIETPSVNLVISQESNEYDDMHLTLPDEIESDNSIDKSRVDDNTNLHLELPDDRPAQQSVMLETTGEGFSATFLELPNKEEIHRAIESQDDNGQETLPLVLPDELGEAHLLGFEDEQQEPYGLHLPPILPLAPEQTNSLELEDEQARDPLLLALPNEADTLVDQSSDSSLGAIPHLPKISTTDSENIDISQEQYQPILINPPHEANILSLPDPNDQQTQEPYLLTLRDESEEILPSSLNQVESLGSSDLELTSAPPQVHNFAEDYKPLIPTLSDESGMLPSSGILHTEESEPRFGIPESSQTKPQITEGSELLAVHAAKISSLPDSRDHDGTASDFSQQAKEIQRTESARVATSTSPDQPLDSYISTHPQTSPPTSISGTSESVLSTDSSPSYASSPDKNQPSANNGLASQFDIVSHLNDLESPNKRIRAAAQEALNQASKTTIPQLMERFPGPLLTNPFAPEVMLPPFSDCGPLLAVITHYGRSAHVYVERRLDVPDPIIRFFATYFYSAVYVPEAIPRLIQRLHDEEARICMTASRTLFGYRNHSAFSQVLGHLHARLSASSVAARRHAAFLIGLFRDVSAVPELIKVLERRERALMDVAEGALTEITKQRFGSNVRKWRYWWAKNQDRNRIEWLIEGLASRESAVRKSACEELRAVTGQDFSYNPVGSRRKREEARKKWLEWWRTAGMELVSS
ncbi:MAG: hypothetical protein KTR25_06435 [Myxococcales bacterium]|nr:hypothetical protein [Myxococcales bacterium]